MTLRKVVIRGRTFENDFIKYGQDSRFDILSQLSASVDIDLQEPIKEYDNGIKLLLFPTSEIADTGEQKWTLYAEKSRVNPVVFYRDIDTKFREIV